MWCPEGIVGRQSWPRIVTMGTPPFMAVILLAQPPAPRGWMDGWAAAIYYGVCIRTLPLAAPPVLRPTILVMTISTSHVSEALCA